MKRVASGTFLLIGGHVVNYEFYGAHRRGARAASC